jgi:hypothetical protein
MPTEKDEPTTNARFMARVVWPGFSGQATWTITLTAQSVDDLLKYVEQVDKWMSEHKPAVASE